MRGGQVVLNSVDLKEQRRRFLKKLFKNRPLCDMSLGNEMVLDRFLEKAMSNYGNERCDFEETQFFTMKYVTGGWEQNSI